MKLFLRLQEVVIFARYPPTLLINVTKYSVFFLQPSLTKNYFEANSLDSLDPHMDKEMEPVRLNLGGTFAKQKKLSGDPQVSLHTGLKNFLRRLLSKASSLE